jgi:hypothetical protein
MENKFKFKAWVTLFCMAILFGMGTQSLQAASEDVDYQQNYKKQPSLKLPRQDLYRPKVIVQKVTSGTAWRP